MAHNDTSSPREESAVETILRYVTRDSLRQPSPVWHQSPECATGDNLAVLDILAVKFARPCPACVGAEDIELNLTDDSMLRLVAPYDF